MNLALAPLRRLPPSVGMAATLSPQRAEQKLRGRALRAIRERRGVYQSNVAEALGITTQAWQKYEAGERRFTREKLTTVLRALGASEADLEIEESRILSQPRQLGVSDTSLAADRLSIDVYAPNTLSEGVASLNENVNPSRTLDLRALFGRNASAVEVAGDAMSPWAEPGEIVVFDRDRYPKRGSGCVIETKSGQLLVRIYERGVDGTVFAKTLYPEERTEQFRLADVKGVYAVRLRGD